MIEGKPTTSATILNVDDDGESRGAVTRSLRRAGFDVVEAETGEAALARAVAEPRPDLIILDVGLPDVDGFEVCRRLRADPQTARAPVLHLSGSYVSGADKAHGLDGGADAYLVRPVEPIELTATVKALLRARRSEERLRASEAQYRMLVEATTDHAIFMLDLDGRVANWNAGAERLLGHAEAAILGRPFATFFAPDERDAGAPERQLALARDAGRAGDMGWRVRADGTRLFVDAVTTAVRDDAGRVVAFAVLLRDVTERRRSEQALAQNERRLRLITDNIPGLVAHVDRELRYTFANERYAEWFGMPAASVIGRSIPELFGPAVVAERGRHFAAALAGQTVTFSARLAQPADDGAAPVEPRDTLTTYVPDRDDRGEVRGFYVFGLDVTALERTRRALAESESQYRTLFDSMDEGYCIVELIEGPGGDDFRFLQANPAFARIAGLDALAGRRMRELMPTAAPEWFAFAAEVARSGVSRRIEREGSRGGRWYDVRAFRVGAAEDRRVAVLVADVTERRRADEALRASEAQFRLIADAMPQIVWVTRPDGFHEYFNRRWYVYTGDRTGWTGGEGWADVVHPDDREAAQARWRHALETGEPYAVEYRLRRIDGAYRWFLGRALPARDAEGRIVRWYGTCTDVHEEKVFQAERERLLASERQARAESDRAGRMKDEFLATLSHELRTPLSAILGWSQLLSRGPDVPEGLRDGLATIERNARAQSQIIEDLLDMSRITNGKLRLEVRDVDLADVLGAAIETVRHAADAKSIALATDFDPAVAAVRGDAGRLQQVFWNLLSNAVKFTPRGGRVRVSLRWRGDGGAEVAVDDTGEGIDAAFLPHVFDRFRQADASSTRRHGGLGLGLSLCRQIVELHGGTIAVESAGAGHGSTFRVSLPPAAAPREAAVMDDGGPSRDRVPGPAPEAVVADEACEGVRGLRVLAVDDEPDARELMRRLLESCGAQVAVAADAVEAFDAVGRERFDLILSDVGMPGEDGHGLMRRIRALPADRGGRTPAVALTAYATADDRARALAAGFQVHVAKPVEPTELFAAMATALRG